MQQSTLRLKIQPRILVFIGGGYIACELAHFFGSLGTEIHIIQRNNVLIPKEDDEISHKFTKVFAKKYNVHLGYDVESVTKNSIGSDSSSSSSDKNFPYSGKKQIGRIT